MCDVGVEVDVEEERSRVVLVVPFAGDKQVNVSPTVAARLLFVFFFLSSFLLSPVTDGRPERSRQ